MHETSIVINILETVTTQCRRDGYKKINSIRLKIGKASHILADSLQFAFEIIREDTIAKDAELIIETIPLTARCKSCSHEFDTSQQLVFECPACTSKSFEIISGYEMEIVDMEVD